MKKKTYTAPVSEVHTIELQHMIAESKLGVSNDSSKAISNPDLVLGRDGGWDDDED